MKIYKNSTSDYIASLFIYSMFFFVCLGIIYFSPYLDTSDTKIRIYQIIGILGVIVYIGYFIKIIQILFKKENGLIIEKNGYKTNSSYTYDGLIEWKDIVKIRTNSKNSKILHIYVKNEEKYLNKLNNPFSKISAKVTKLMYGSSFLINFNYITISASEFEIIVKEYFSNKIKL